MSATVSAVSPPPGRRGWHEDSAAILVGAALVGLALAVGWAFRPTADAGSRERYPKGWPSALSSTINKPQTWNASPAEALADRKGKPVGAAILLGLGWVVAVSAAGAVLRGHAVARVIPGAAVLGLLGALAYLLAAQKVIHYYNLEYPLWALVVGLVIGNTVGVPSWLAPALQGEYLIKTGLVLFGAEVLFSRLLELGLPGLLTSWVVTPIVLVATYLFGVHALRIPSRSLCMVISADMSVCGVSAAIATGAACRAKKEELSLAIGLSLAFTAVMMVAMPPFIRLAGIDPIVGGAWLGGTIDATGAVAAAGEILGRDLGDKRPAEVATTVKMIQNSMIGLIAFAVAVYWSGWVERGTAPMARSLAAEAWLRFPKFILGFLGTSILCSALFTTSPETALLVDGAIAGFTGPLRGWLFCVGFVCMGLQTVFRELAPVLVSGRPLLLYVLGQGLNLALSLAMATLTFGWLFRQGAGP
ncbi:MAG: putative sulfate exporter family transporter [Planctomycetes bacterium]|nr:putative sulfate exporter family transporter [Planctomycetota bacterium]